MFPAALIITAKPFPGGRGAELQGRSEGGEEGLRSKETTCSQTSHTPRKQTVPLPWPQRGLGQTGGQGHRAGPCFLPSSS